MNYEVMCIVGFEGVVERVAFETYAEAKAWADKRNKDYDDIAVLPLNAEAAETMP